MRMVNLVILRLSANSLRLKQDESTCNGNYKSGLAKQKVIILKSHQ